VFCTNARQTLVIRWSAGKPGKINSGWLALANKARCLSSAADATTINPVDAGLLAAFKEGIHALGIDGL